MDPEKETEKPEEKDPAHSKKDPGKLPLDPDGNERHRKRTQFERRTALAMGLFIGVLGATLFVLFGLQYFMENVASVAAALLIAILVIIAVALIGYWYRDQIFKRLFKTPRTSIGDAVETLNEVVQAAVKKDFDGSYKAGIKSLQVVTAWYAWINMRRLFVNIVVSMIVAFGGILGSVYLYKQNTLIETQSDLLQTQNALIEKENFLLESDRRAALLSELSNVFNEIDEELDVVEAKNLPRTLSKRLIGRIVALSKSLKPYRYLDTNGDLISRPVSPERAQLFLTLIELDLDNLNELLTNGNFQYCDLPSTPISQKDFNGLGLNYSSFRYAELSGLKFSKAHLFKTDFSHAKMTEVDFSFAEMDSTSFESANIQPTAKFWGAFARGSRFSRAQLVGVDFRGAELSGSDFSGVDAVGIKMLVGGAPKILNNQFQGAGLRGVQFIKANLENADFSGADLRKANFTDANLTDVNISEVTRLDSVIFLRTLIRQDQLRDLKAAGLDTSGVNRQFIFVREE
ncbi:MAG: pentapeptide repeat-containing protein [Bacteroidia bacterium]|nr:pentapeptide repeat-containing protein [Bacteroidia bacterium]